MQPGDQHTDTLGSMIQPALVISPLDHCNSH